MNPVAAPAAAGAAAAAGAVPGTRFAGKLVLITGASSGIGAATARLLAADGAMVVLAARRADKLDALAAEIGTARALAVACDVTDAAAMVAAVAKAEAWAHKPLDVALLNAGVMSLAPITDGDVAAWARMVDVNVKGVLHGVAAVLPRFKAAGDVGDLIVMSSDAGRKIFPGGSVYCATKWAVEAIVQGVRQETAGTRIRVASVQPGATKTDLVAAGDSCDAFRTPPPGMPLLDADDVARAVAYIVAQPPGVAVNEVLVRPTGQRS